MSPLLLAALAQSIVPVATPSESGGDPCTTFESAPTSQAEALPMSIAELAEIADIGSPVPGSSPALGISPDRKRIAVLVSRGNPGENQYCQRLLVLPISGQGLPVEIARGGAYIADDYSLRDFSFVQAGWPRPNPPRWSPDGTLVAFLRREEGRTQVWLADPNGGLSPRQATDLADDIDAFAWAADGKGLVVATRPGIHVAARAIAEEGNSGFLYDKRFAPQLSDRPIPTGEVTTRYTFASLSEGYTRVATAEERAMLAPLRPGKTSATATMWRTGTQDRLAWIEPKEPDQILSPTRLVIADPDGRRRVCSRSECEGIFELWWSSDGTSLMALQRTGWARSRTALLRWDNDEALPERVFETDDIIAGCKSAGREAICTREGSTRPIRIVAFNLGSGAQRIVYDPNPQLADTRWGEVRRLRFRNAYGVESFADLVLPPGHRPGERLPMVVAGYSSRGFLRGGTGDDVPIQPLAARGFAVLSFARPGFLPSVREARSEIETRTLLEEPWADRRSVLSSLEMAIELAVGSGAVDQRRIGITGFSDGGASAQFALINSDLFAAASFTTCCEDSGSFALVAGPRFTDYLRAMGYPYFDGAADAFWQPMSLLRNVENIDTPILILAADSEYEAALDVWETYRHRGKAIEMRVFPGETHYRWRPAHRLATYRWQIDWFSFWLAHQLDCSAPRMPQYARWLAFPGAPERSDLHCYPPASTAP